MTWGEPLPVDMAESIATQEAADHALTGHSESQDSQLIVEAYMRQYGNDLAGDDLVGGNYARQVPVDYLLFANLAQETNSQLPGSSMFASEVPIPGTKQFTISRGTKPTLFVAKSMRLLLS